MHSIGSSTPSLATLWALAMVSMAGPGIQASAPLGAQVMVTPTRAVLEGRLRSTEVLLINGGDRTGIPTRPPTVQEFLEQVYLPFYRGKWKESTASTSENRLQHHIVKQLGGQRMEDLTLAGLQQFLDRKAASGLSFSIVDHLRWDLASMLEMAVSEKVITVNPTRALYTPRTAKRGESPAMSAKQVEQAVAALECREKLILHLAIFAGIRPGELLAIQREHVKADGSVIEVRRRVYRGKFADPKNGLVRTIAVPPRTACLLAEWMEKAVEPNPEACLFAGETGHPLWRSSLLDDHIKAKLNPIGLGWVNFQVMRRTHASLGHHAKVDPKVAADQRGHGIGVALDVYTKSSIEDRAAAAKQLEESVLTNVVPIRKRSA